MLGLVDGVELGLLLGLPDGERLGIAEGVELGWALGRPDGE